MPYKSISDLPEPVRKALPKHAQEIYLKAFNAAYETTCKNRKDRDACAAKIAWAAVKKVYKRTSDGKWVTRNVAVNFQTPAASTIYSRYEEYNGKQHLVVPVVAIAEGVLNGEFVPAEEIGRYVEAWNGIPVPLGHPTTPDGSPITANSPDVLERQCLGRFFNASFDGKRLKGELWIDVEKARSL
ncbi:MAG: ChaB family protein, partial [Deltaproteobacteria bacterium]|nr:ChaB family protein [Deltaproteobacteria bacterium]